MGITRLDIKGCCRKMNIPTLYDYQTLTCDHLEKGIFFDIYYHPYTEQNNNQNKYASILTEKYIYGDVFITLRPSEIISLYRTILKCDFCVV